MGKKTEPTRVSATSKSSWAKSVILAGLLCTALPRLDAQTSFATGYDQHWSYEDCNGHIWQIVFSYGSISFGYMDLTRAANAPPAASGTKLSSFSTATDQHWVFQTPDGHIRQIVYTYSSGGFSNDDLTQRAGAEVAMLYSGLSSFATTYDQHWVYQTFDGHIRQIVFTYSSGRFGTGDLTVAASAEPGTLYSELSSFATTNDQHWVYQTSDGHIRQIVYTYSTGRIGSGDLTVAASAQPGMLHSGLSSFATAADQHWVYQTNDGHVRQIVFTYRTGGFGSGDLTQAAGIPPQDYPLFGTGLGSFATSTDQNWVFQSPDNNIRQIVFTYTGGFSNGDLTQRAGAPDAGSCRFLPPV
jgi:hypothetical protein